MIISKNVVAVQIFKFPPQKTKLYIQKRVYYTYTLSPIAKEIEYQNTTTRLECAYSLATKCGENIKDKIDRERERESVGARLSLFFF